MISHRSITKTILLSTIIFLSFSFSNNAKAQDGKALFSQNCAACHAIDKRLTGPALAGVQDRWPDQKKLYSWIKNNQAFLKTGDAYANNLYNEFGKVPMNLFPNLTDAEIGAILKYIKDWKPAAAPVAAANAPAPEGDSTLLFGILTLILAIVAFTLMQVNSNLRKLSADKEGEAYPEPVPFWKNKAYIAFVTVILFLVGGYYTTKGAIGLGRNKNYQPEQPIFYSHKVHAGINQVNCLYCHGGAQDSKHASIPSLKRLPHRHPAQKL